MFPNSNFPLYIQQTYYYPYPMPNMHFESSHFGYQMPYQNLKDFTEEIQQNSSNSRIQQVIKKQPQNQVTLSPDVTCMKNIRSEKNATQTEDFDKNYTSKNQKPDRNLDSIVLRNFTKFYAKHPRREEIVSNIIEQKEMDLTQDFFWRKFDSYLPSHKSYVKIGSFKQLIVQTEQNQDIRQVVLILFRKFISIDFFLVILPSNKMKHCAKVKELRHRRKLWNHIKSNSL